MIEIERKYNLTEQMYNHLAELFTWEGKDTYTKQYYAKGETVIRFEPIGKTWSFKHTLTPERRVEIETNKTLYDLQEKVLDEHPFLQEELDNVTSKVYEKKTTDFVHTERHWKTTDGVLITLDKFSNGKVTLYEIEFELKSATQFNTKMILSYVDIKKIDNRNKLTKLHKGIK